jgi:hypothetical protein
MQLTRLERSLALASAGKSIAAKMAMMAITTSNSIRVKAALAEGRPPEEAAITPGRFAILIVDIETLLTTPLLNALQSERRISISGCSLLA